MTINTSLKPFPQPQTTSYKLEKKQTEGGKQQKNKPKTLLYWPAEIVVYHSWFLKLYK